MNTSTVFPVLALQIKDVSDETMLSRSKLCFFCGVVNGFEMTQSW